MQDLTPLLWVATDTVTGLIQNGAASAAAKKQALATPTYGATFAEDMQARKQALYFGGGDTEANAPSPSLIRLSEDEVIANALARQEAKKGFNGLNVSLTDSPAQQNAKNGGLNVGYSTAQDAGVVYGKDQYMKGMTRTDGAGDLKEQADATNTINGVNKTIRKAQLMNGVESLELNTNEQPKLLQEGDRLYKPDLFGVTMSAGEELSKLGGRLGGAMVATKENAKYLNARKATAMLTLPYEEAAKVTKITSASGRILDNAGGVANGFKILGNLASAGNIIKDTINAPSGGAPFEFNKSGNQKLEAFAGSATSSALGGFTVQSSTAIGVIAGAAVAGTEAGMWLGPYGALAGGLIFGIGAAVTYEFSGASEKVKTTTTNRLLEINGKK